MLLFALSRITCSYTVTASDETGNMKVDSTAGADGADGFTNSGNLFNFYNTSTGEPIVAVETVDDT